MHLKMPGWHRTLCNRDTVFTNAETTEQPGSMTCEVCRRRWAVLERTEIYAGEPIRLVEIDWWAKLPRPYRYRFCRRFTETHGVHGLAWYQFSRRQRDLLLSEIRKDGAAAWVLGIPGIEPERVGVEHLKPIWRAQRRIISEVMKGKQDPADLRRVLELQQEIARGVFDG